MKYYLALISILITLCLSGLLRADRWEDQTSVKLDLALTEAFACLAPLNGTPYLDQSSPPQSIRFRGSYLCQLEAASGSGVINMSFGSACTETCNLPTPARRNIGFVEVSGAICNLDTRFLVFETQAGLNLWKRDISKLCAACDERDQNCIYP